MIVRIQVIKYSDGSTSIFFMNADLNLPEDVGYMLSDGIFALI